MTSRRLPATLLFLAVPWLGGCGGDESGSPPAAERTPVVTVSATDTEQLAPSLDERLQVGSPRRELAIRCWGSGKPAVVLDAGSSSGGIETFGGMEDELIEPLAERSTVCAYDRAGSGLTIGLPNKRRTIDDQAEELDALLTAAAVPKPRVLVGSSWGGGVAVNTARNHPQGIGGIVLLDVPPGNAHLTPKEAPEAAWDHPANIERVDSFHAERKLALDKRSLGSVPVTVVTADAGQSSKKEQQVWKRLSSNFSQVVLSGGHDIYADDPEGVVKQILKTVDAAR